MKFLVIHDECLHILGYRYLNSQVSFCLGMLQLVICIWAAAQHFFSLIRYNQILFCDFINGTEPVLLVGVDIIIFDIGLFHSLWDIDSCVAEHLDGGYGRCVWCVCHIFAFVTCLPFAFVARPRPYCLWSLLIQQSAYCIGLLILSLAALPRVLPTFTGDENSASILSLLIYITGASLNFFLLYVYWHWYWHVEATWDSARKLRLNCNNNAMIQRSNKTLAKYVDVLDDIAQKCNEPQSPFIQIHPATSQRFLTDSNQEQVVAVASKNLLGAKNLVNHSDYDGFYPSIQCRESYDKCGGDVHVTHGDKHVRLVKNNSKKKLNCYGKRTTNQNLRSSGCLHSKRTPLWR